MSGEPQGGIKIRKRNNDAPSAWRRDRDPYGDYGYRRPYYQRSSPTIPVAAGHSAGGETDRLTVTKTIKFLLRSRSQGRLRLVFWPRAQQRFRPRLRRPRPHGLSRRHGQHDVPLTVVCPFSAPLTMGAARSAGD